MTGYWRQLFLVILCISCSRSIVQAASYEVVGDDEYFMRDCTDKEDSTSNLSIEDVVKNDLKHVYSDDLETVYTSGTMTVTSAMRGDLPVQMQLDFFIWVRSDWVNSPLSMHRNDFCKTIHDPTEPWSPLFSEFPKEEVVCPPQPGTVYTITNCTNRSELKNLPPFGVAGKYKIMIHFTQANNTLCLVCLAHLYKM